MTEMPCTAATRPFNAKPSMPKKKKLKALSCTCNSQVICLQHCTAPNRLTRVIQQKIECSTVAAVLTTKVRVLCGLFVKRSLPATNGSFVLLQILYQ